MRVVYIVVIKHRLRAPAISLPVILILVKHIPGIGNVHQSSSIVTKKPTKAVMKNIETNLISATLGFGIATTAMNATNEASNMTMFTANNAGFI